MNQKFYKTSLSLVLVLLLAFIPTSSTYSSTLYEQSQTMITSYAEQVTTSLATNYTATELLANQKAKLLTSNTYGVTSVQYALIDNGKIVVSGQAGVYSKEDTSPLTKNNLYGIGSISKIFTTTAVLQLVDKGQVNLDKPVVKYIPEFTMADPRYKKITVRMLLNHSSGLMGSVYHNTFSFNDVNPDYDLLADLKTSRLKADPGEFSVYCNDGFTLASILVEKVSGMSFTKYIEKNITTPLTLENTKTPYDEFQRDNLAKTYLSGSKTALPPETLSVIGAGGIYSSAEDMCHLAGIFMDATSTKILSKASATATQKPEYLNGLWPQTENSLLSYGLGWDSVDTYPFNEYGIKALVKGGDTLLYHASLIVLPGENLAMAVLSSGGSSSYDQLMAQEVLLSALEAKGSLGKTSLDTQTSTSVFTPKASPMPADIIKMAGIYAYSGGAAKVTIDKTGKLTLKNLISSSIPQIFTYTADGKFYSSNGSASVALIEESNGNTYLNINVSNNLPGLGTLLNSEYQAQLITANPISPDVKAVWEKRSNKKYFCINEAYNSQQYALSAPFLKLSLLSDLEGYFMDAAIQDKSTAKAVVKIPGIYGRDLKDYEFYTQDGTEYLKSAGSLSVSEDSLGTLSTKSTFTYTIKADGYSQWYKIASSSADKKIKVTFPKNSSFSVYTANGGLIYTSTISAPATVKLPLGGYLVFAGSPKAKFTVTYTK